MYISFSSVIHKCASAFPSPYTYVYLLHLSHTGMCIRAATIHGYIDEAQYESQQYRINTQAKNVSIFSRKLTRNYDRKAKYFPVSKASVKFYFPSWMKKPVKNSLVMRSVPP